MRKEFAMSDAIRSDKTLSWWLLPGVSRPRDGLDIAMEEAAEKRR
jgi:hypothetical protein